MDTIIVGGNWTNGPDHSASGVVKKLCGTAHPVRCHNGGEIKDIPTKLVGYDLIIWMPNISNEEEKIYPVKGTGSVLICSKVMRKGYTRADSVARIFKMHGNAVIEIRKKDDRCHFTLVDALGNVWAETSNIDDLWQAITEFYTFTKSAVRCRTHLSTEPIFPTNIWKFLNRKKLKELLDINKELQYAVKVKCGDRFFGNISTRCQKLFPSARVSENGASFFESTIDTTDNIQDCMWVSPRNTDKETLSWKDMIRYNMYFDQYHGNKKPSVDSPCQARLYRSYPNINYMIHGHATIHTSDAYYTGSYRLCGDLREVDEILSTVPADTKGCVVNLKKHGFLIMADNLSTLRKTVDMIKRGAVIEIK